MRISDWSSDVCSSDLLRRSISAATRANMEKNSEASPVAAPAGTRKMGNLRFIWRYASHYPGRVAAAALSLLLASGATLAIPSGFKRVIDTRFVAGGGDILPYFHYLFMFVFVFVMGPASL